MDIKVAADLQVLFITVGALIAREAHRSGEPVHAMHEPIINQITSALQKSGATGESVERYEALVGHAADHLFQVAQVAYENTPPAGPDLP